MQYGDDAILVCQIYSETNYQGMIGLMLPQQLKNSSYCFIIPSLLSKTNYFRTAQNGFNQAVGGAASDPDVLGEPPFFAHDKHADALSCRVFLEHALKQLSLLIQLVGSLQLP